MTDWRFDEAERMRRSRPRLWWAAAVAAVVGILIAAALLGLVGFLVEMQEMQEAVPPPTVTVYYVCEANERYGNSTFIVGVEYPLYGPWPTSWFMSDFPSDFSVRCRNWEGR